jgi:hypothetical protein
LARLERFGMFEICKMGSGNNILNHGVISA